MTENSNWTKQDYYLGNSGYPSEVTYRTHNETGEIQRKAWRSYPFNDIESLDETRSVSITPKMLEILNDWATTTQDLNFKITSPYKVYSGGLSSGLLFIEGWVPLTTDEELDSYANFTLTNKKNLIGDMPSKEIPVTPEHVTDYLKTKLKEQSETEISLSSFIRGLAARTGLTFEDARTCIYRTLDTGEVIITPRFSLALADS